MSLIKLANKICPKCGFKICKCSNQKEPIIKKHTTILKEVIEGGTR